ncbi:hypothetical protein KR51_00036540 [Rubidibacter lacunae KORDI 51-2]|uniref:Uncharacterized protein n=1 Tax=Rubidibacter lacunae KORDI 51-2 TaxID=582515 RepID=U5DE22_9CHRO|nr:hypothetical protein KR51_00036540 [Rubidibacter lacunae KORDI 51-2]
MAKAVILGQTHTLCISSKFAIRETRADVGFEKIICVLAHPIAEPRIRSWQRNMYAFAQAWIIHKDFYEASNPCSD